MWVALGGTAAKTTACFFRLDGEEAARGGCYSSGSFCKLVWSRGPADVAADRATYAAWHAALAWLAERLSSPGETGQPSLTSRRPKPPTAPMSPWLGEAVRPRVLRVISASDTGSVPIERSARTPRSTVPLRQLPFGGRPLAA